MPSVKSSILETIMNSSVLDTAILIHKLANTGHPLKLDFIPIPEVFGDYKEIPRRKRDLRKARKLLGYQPLVSLEDGLNKVVEAWKSKS